MSSFLYRFLNFEYLIYHNLRSKVILPLARPLFLHVTQKNYCSKNDKDDKNNDDSKNKDDDKNKNKDDKSKKDYEDFETYESLRSEYSVHPDAGMRFWQNQSKLTQKQKQEHEKEKIYYEKVPYRKVYYDNPLERALCIIRDDIKEFFGLLKDRTLSELRDPKTDRKKMSTRQPIFPHYCDVVIIGGGLVGSSIAFHLQEKSKSTLKIVVVEKDLSVSISFLSFYLELFYFLKYLFLPKYSSTGKIPHTHKQTLINISILS